MPHFLMHQYYLYSDYYFLQCKVASGDLHDFYQYLDWCYGAPRLYPIGVSANTRDIYLLIL